MALATKTKPKHKKRQAQHHNHSKHYLKTYWPYLPMVALVSAAVTLHDRNQSASPATETSAISASLLGFQPSYQVIAASALVAAAGLAFYAISLQEAGRRK